MEKSFSTSSSKGSSYDLTFESLLKTQVELSSYNSSFFTVINTDEFDQLLKNTENADYSNIFGGLCVQKVGVDNYMVYDKSMENYAQMYKMFNNSKIGLIND